ncbi:MAG: MerC domain-containing protein [Bacteroidota bacterium]
MKAIQFASKSDVIGAWASGLCLVHCLATPFLFVAQAGLVSSGESHPQWWGVLDFVFLAVSFLAIWWSSKTTSKRWIQIALWASWLLLLFIVLNEKFSLLPLAEQAIYVPAIGLIFFHLYNRRYCQCGNTACSDVEA